jgi:hypothetical protein
MIEWLAAQPPIVGAIVGYVLFIALLLAIAILSDLPKQRAYRRRVEAEDEALR